MKDVLINLLSILHEESPLQALENRLYPTPIQEYPENWAAERKLFLK